MSATTPSFQPSSVGGFRSSKSPGIGDAIRSLLSLLWIEIRRSQGYWLLPLMVGLGIFMNRNMSGDGVVLWPDLSTWTMQSYMIVGPLAAALAAWIVDRDRRRRVQGLVETMATSPFRRDVVHVATAAFWGLVGYGLIAAWYGFQGVREATWGGPDLALIGTGALAIVILTGVGFIVGRLVRGKFSPILAVAVAFFVAAAPDFIQELTRNRSETYTDLAIRPLTPWGLVGDRGTDIYSRFAPGYLSSALLWLTGAAAVVLCVIALLRGWRRNWSAWAALAASCAVALFGANLVMAYDDGYSYSFENDLRIPFTWSCETTAAVEVCVHPAYESRLEESTRGIDAVVAPLVGLADVPTRWQQNSPFGRSDVGDLSPGNYFRAADQVAFTVFTPQDFTGGFTASQNVILEWLSRRANPDEQQPGMFGNPAELFGTPVAYAGGVGYEIDNEPEAQLAYEREITAAADRFAALSPEAQRAWLEAN